jgi:hypothetical protein
VSPLATNPANAICFGVRGLSFSIPHATPVYIP